MTQQQHMNELQETVNGIMERWCPATFNHEPMESRMLRVILHLNAYELDAKRSLAGEAPIRTDYPLPLPKP
jgi:hypothetical protein